ncbi:carboxypeptidase-like regulatory domain-containing protein [Flexithrix dorotheae]|uniref:carboxypeptidase-like regulatory domain-containing protein n=1 Tax=Flexithrix dorotheae TaxID=70993 RepID=UPI000373287B|nr:carboxypeptidase-like regulatory domain-containing protein [Flexithrix dorotheae]
MKKSTFIFCGILLILASCSEAYFGGGGESPDPNGCPCASVNGEVIGLSSNLYGQEISLTKKGSEIKSFITTINVDGTYVFEQVPQGSYEVEIDGFKMNYEINKDRIISINLNNRFRELELVK